MWGVVEALFEEQDERDTVYKKGAGSLKNGCDLKLKCSGAKTHGG